MSALYRASEADPLIGEPELFLVDVCQGLQFAHDKAEALPGVQTPVSHAIHFQNLEQAQTSGDCSRDTQVDGADYCQTEACGGPAVASCLVEGRRVRVCRKHQQAQGAVTDIRLCGQPTCTQKALYGQRGQRPAVCAQHRAPGMVSPRGKACHQAGCENKPSCGFAGGRPQFCTEHCPEDMVSLVGRSCSFEGCHTKSSFGVPGSKAHRCQTHAEEGMVNVSKRRCQSEGCHKTPHFGAPGCRAKFCSEHRPPGAVNVFAKCCQAQQGCTKQATYNMPGLSPALCASHRAAGMVDVTRKKCQHEGGSRCPTRCSFGHPGGAAQFCKAHRLPGMVDVVNPTCQEKGCCSKPSYGFTDDPNTHCAEHRLPGQHSTRRRLYDSPRAKDQAWGKEQSRSSSAASPDAHDFADGLSTAELVPDAGAQSDWGEVGLWSQWAQPSDWQTALGDSARGQQHPQHHTHGALPEGIREPVATPPRLATTLHTAAPSRPLPHNLARWPGLHLKGSTLKMQ